MRFLFYIVVVILFQSCASRISTSALMQEADSTRVSLMRRESDVYGNFFKVRTFHQDLMQVLNTTEAEPYPHMESLFRVMVDEANGAVMQRMIYDTVYYQIKNISANKKYIQRKGENVKVLHEFDSLKSTLPAKQMVFEKNYNSVRAEYQSDCNTHGIIRMGPADYAALIDSKLTAWQDSLEEIGRMVAREKQNLKGRFPQQKGAEFFAAYQPVSQLEAMMKNFDSMLSQLANSLSRFEEGNKDDFIYFGPHVRQRMEVQVTDDLIGQLALQMAECRQKDKQFFLSAK